VTEAVARLQTLADEPLVTRVGIATGIVVVGNMTGESGTDKDAVVGETPNLAARLQSVAPRAALWLVERPAASLANYSSLKISAGMT
jgi:class 3 adenylate cyclase